MTPEEKKLYNCPNCGAPIGYSPVCLYCGTRLRWEPFPDTIEYKVTHVPVKYADIKVAVPMWMEKDGRAAPYLTAELVKRAAAFVVNHIRLKKEEDLIRCQVIYHARVGFADMIQDCDRGEYVRVRTDPTKIEKA